MAKYNRFKNRRRKNSKKRTYVGKGFYEHLWKLSSRYANHMGDKFSLSDSEVKKNTRESYQLAKKDVDHMRFLVHEYDTKDY